MSGLDFGVTSISATLGTFPTPFFNFPSKVNFCSTNWRCRSCTNPVLSGVDERYSSLLGEAEIFPGPGHYPMAVISDFDLFQHAPWFSPNPQSARPSLLRFRPGVGYGVNIRPPPFYTGPPTVSPPPTYGQSTPVRVEVP